MEIEKEEAKAIKRKEIIKISIEIRGTKTRKMIKKFLKKKLVIKKINKIDTSLAKWTKKKREETQITKPRNGSGDSMTNSIEKKYIIREPYEQLYSDKMDNLDEMNIFLETKNLPRPNNEKQKM